MTIKAIQMYKDGFVQQPFVFGGEEGKDAFDASIRYPQSLQNFVVDTGDEVILVDTGVPDDFAVPAPGPQTALHLGEKIQNYLDGLRALGYAPEQVTKILITHKHPDHTGQLAAFPNAKVYMSRAEADAMKLDGGNIVRCDFTDGPYYEFPASQLIAPGVRLLPAVGHTTGNSIVVVEDGGLFYMMHGDVTYCDEALKANKLSLVFEDKAAARETLNRVRAFIKARPTVYLSTHYPTGVTNLETNCVMKLDGIPVGCPADGGAGYYGKAKGTPLEKTLAQLAAGEAQGGGMYYALARIAQGFGLAAVAEELVDLGNQETNHAGFYWTLVGKYPQDKTAFWKLLAGLSKAEYKGDANIGAIAAKLEEMGLKDAAAEARVYAKQELHHGVATQAILEKYAPEFIAPQPGGKRYVCPVCGYEHEGDLDALPDDWKCPICGAAKKAFKELT